MQFNKWMRHRMRVSTLRDVHWGRFTCVALDECRGRLVTVLTDHEAFPLEWVVELLA